MNVGVIAPMPSELRPLVRMLGLRRAGEQGAMPVYTGSAGDTDIVATMTGIGPSRAEAATERLLDFAPIDRVIVSGIAGGLEPASAIGDLVVPEEVVDKTTGERFSATAFGQVSPHGVIRTGDGSDYELDEADVARLVGEGFTALDMETAAVARVCQQRGAPWLAFRAISDMAADPSVGPVVMTLVNPDGSPKVGASIRFLLSHPRRIPRMMRLARDASAAANTAARATVSNIRAS